MASIVLCVSLPRTGAALAHCQAGGGTARSPCCLSLRCQEDATPAAARRGRACGSRVVCGCGLSFLYLLSVCVFVLYCLFLSFFVLSYIPVDCTRSR